MADFLTIKPEAREAWSSLAAALDLLEAVGRRTPCQVDPDPFGSDDKRERSEAAATCGWCPLLEVCDAFATANGETNNVWGGRDWTVHPQTSRRRRREAVAS